MDLKKIVLIGGGGYCSGVIDSIMKMGEFEIIGITDPDKVKGSMICGFPVLGDDSCLHQIYESGVIYAHVTVGTIGDFSLRKKLIRLAEEIGFELVSVIDPSSLISQYVKLGKMIYVGKSAVINSMVTINDYCIINTKAVVEHGCFLENHVHIAPSAALAGDIYIGHSTHIGINATLLQGIHIGNHCIIGAGSTVLGNVQDSQIVYGIVKKGN